MVKLYPESQFKIIFKIKVEHFCLIDRFLYNARHAPNPPASRAKKFSYPPLVSSKNFLTNPLVKVVNFPGSMSRSIKNLFVAKNRPFGPINFLPTLVSSIIFCTHRL